MRYFILSFKVAVVQCADITDSTLCLGLIALLSVFIMCITHFLPKKHKHKHTHTHLPLCKSVPVEQKHSVVHGHQVDLCPRVTSDLETKALPRRVVSTYAVDRPDIQL